MESVLNILTNPYYNQVLTTMGIFLIAALGLHLITGITGQFSFGHAAFVSIGAYSSALMTIYLHTPFFLNMVAGGLSAPLPEFWLGIQRMGLPGDNLG